MTSPFQTAGLLYQHLVALRCLERERPADYADIVARHRRTRKAVRK